MKAVRLLAGALGIALLLVLPYGAAAANRYVTYVACSYKSSASPATSCSKSSNKGAFFKSRDASVTYEVCVKYPSGQKLCASGQSAPRGTTQLNKITTTQKGTHKVTWLVGSTRVGSWAFKVT